MDSKMEYDRVTAILAPFSGMDKIDPTVLANAAARGSLVHALCQGWIDGIDVEPPEHVKGYFDSFVEWAQGQTFKKTPERMYCNVYKITGECDGLLSMEDGQVWLFDLKTSASESCTWKYQSAAYAYLLELGGVKIDAEVFVRLSKDGKRAKQHFYSMRENIDVFFKCRELYNIFFKNKVKINEDYL